MDTKGEKEVQPYEKPKLRIIELAAEEVLAPSCKTLSLAAPLSPIATCNAQGCAGIGS